jgi:predicted membrane protein
MLINSTRTANILLLIIPRLFFTACVVLPQNLCAVFFVSVLVYFVYFSLENWKNMCTCVNS